MKYFDSVIQIQHQGCCGMETGNVLAHDQLVPDVGHTHCSDQCQVRVHWSVRSYLGNCPLCSPLPQNVVLYSGDVTYLQNICDLFRWLIN